MSNVSPSLGFLTVSLMIALSPGPSWADTISTTLGHGRKCTMFGNLGNSAGILCHALAVALGLVAGIIHTHLIFFSSGISRRLKSPGKAQKAIRWATGTVFLGFATRLVLADQ